MRSICVVRPATRADVAGLPEIERAACVRFDALGIANVLGEILTPLADLTTGADEGALFVAEADATLVGFALCSPLDGGLHLDEVDVLPAYGRRGIGAALVAAVVDLARHRGLGHLTLSTLGSVPWNAPWYARLGFRILGSHEHTPVLVALLDHERARGFPMDDRVLMRRDL